MSTSKIMEFHEDGKIVERDNSVYPRDGIACQFTEGRTAFVSVMDEWTGADCWRVSQDGKVLYDHFDKPNGQPLPRRMYRDVMSGKPICIWMGCTHFIDVFVCRAGKGVKFLEVRHGKELADVFRPGYEIRLQAEQEARAEKKEREMKLLWAKEQAQEKAQKEERSESPSPEKQKGRKKRKTRGVP